MAAARRPIVLDFVPRVASPERNRAAVPGVAGRCSRPRAAHQTVKIAKSERYARRVELAFSFNAKARAVSISAWTMAGRAGASMTARALNMVTSV
jgi:hypothetical protein